MKEPTRATLVLMGGLPGVGKSALATELGRLLPAVVVSVDDIEDGILRAGVPRSFETGLAAYEVGAAVAQRQLTIGLWVIADAANYLKEGREIWRRAARLTGARVCVIDVESSDRAVHRERLQRRERGLSHFPEPTWDEVELRRAVTEPWDEESILRIDSVGPLAASVSACLSFLGRPSQQ